MTTITRHMQSSSTVIKGMATYAESEWYNSNANVDYFVLKLLFDIKSNEPDLLSMLLYNLHQNVLPMENDKSKAFYFEIGSYKETGDKMDIIVVPSNDGSSNVNLTLFVIQKYPILGYRDVCHEQPPITFHKVHVCPYVEIHLDETITEIKNGILILNNGISKQRLSEFEYLRIGQNASICLSDYLLFYNTFTHVDDIPSSNGSETLGLVMFGLFVELQIAVAVVRKYFSEIFILAQYL